jgi:hypothetical protein
MQVPVALSYDRLLWPALTVAMSVASIGTALAHWICCDFE